MARTLGIGFLRRHDADIIEELVPEAAVEQMERRVLHAAVVPVDRAPVAQGLGRGKGLVVVRIHIAQIVPRGTGPLGHGVRFTLGWAAAAGAGRVDPVRDGGKRRLTVVRRLVALDIRQLQRQVLLIERDGAALRAVDDGDRLAPVTLAGEDPVAELEVDLRLADVLLRQVFRDGLLGVGDAHAVKEAGIDHHAGGAVRKGRLLHVAALDDLDDLAAELLREFPVAVVMGRDGHDRTGSVGGEDIVRNEDGDLFAVHGVDALHAAELHAGLLLRAAPCAQSRTSRRLPPDRP